MTGPGIVDVSVALTVATSNPLTLAAVTQAIQQNVLAWIVGLPIGGTLAVSKIEALAHNTDPSVLSVTGTTINGANLDITASASSVLMPLSVVVN